MRSRFAFAALAIGALAVAGCGSSSSGSAQSTDTSTTSAPAASTTAASTTVPTTATTLSTADYGQQYLAIVTPLNTDLTQLGTTLQNLPASDTGPQVQTAVDPTIAALKSAQSQLQAVQWPGAAETDVTALVGGIGTVNDDLGSFNGLTTSQQATTLTQKLLQDLTTCHTQSDAVRTDLGLPVTSSS